jgi:hypothetical protein
MKPQREKALLASDATFQEKEEKENAEQISQPVVRPFVGRMAFVVAVLVVVVSLLSHKV